MPLIHSAIKKMRQDLKKTKENRDFKVKLKSQIKKAKKGKTADSVKTAISLLDKAVKKKILKKNTANRYKSQLTKNKKVK